MTRPFADLTTPGQVRRLRLLGKEALRAFGLQPDLPMVLLHHGENTTFKITDRRGRHRVLRVHRDGYQTPQAIRSELMWLAALARDTTLRVPAPTAGTDGETVQIVHHRLVDGPRACTLLSWVPGRFRIRRGSYGDFHLMGRLSAELHAHAQAWRRPAGFRRRAWTEQGLVSPNALWGDPVNTPWMTAAQKRVLGAAREQVCDQLAEYGRARDRFGLIHADLHIGNVLIEKGRAHAIDFDDCGAGWFMYDAAVSLGASLMHERYADSKAGYFDGYREVRELDETHVENLDMFFVARRLALTGWIAKRADNPRLRQFLPTSLKLTLKVCRRYLKTGRVP